MCVNVIQCRSIVRLICSARYYAGGDTAGAASLPKGLVVDFDSPGELTVRHKRVL